ncbi:MAG: DUF1549 domain-containing protein, partial [Planctomycetes bacterium]|nr:DUF1549 domain-containing protein [Planctomycetota bacterium]
MSGFHRLRHKAFGLMACAVFSTCVAGQAAAAVRYGRDILPILADRCFRCHGPDHGARKADLRLDLRAEATAQREAGPAIVPGDAAGSQLYQRVTATDPEERMPPAHAQKPDLSPRELELVATWIDAGAAYEDHWAFVPPVRPEVPSDGEPWARNPIDRFLFAELQRRGLQPSPEADPATLARRAFLVLTGLPPEPEELDAFLADTAPDAYDRLVDRLLGTEPYRSRHAEHLAGPWLDAARYADTCGIHMDAGRQIWPWRDWLLRAIRDDKPFDDFVVEQLAGDLLPDASIDQRTATGFLRAHVTTDEGGAIDQEYLVEYAAERTATVGSVLFGLTLNCARCHDHKFDPITQRDYYGLFAFFYNNNEPGLYSQSKDSNRALEPRIEVPSAELLERRGLAEAALASAEQALLTEDAGEVELRRGFFADLDRDNPVTWPTATVVATASRSGSMLAVQDDGSILASGGNPAQDVQSITLRTTASDLRLLCLEALPDASLPGGRVGRAPNGNAVLRHIRLEVRADDGDDADGAAWQQVPLAWAMADVEQDNGDFGVTNALTEDDRVWAVA